MDAAKNFAKGTLSTGYDDTATSIVLNTGDGARFPAAPFNAVWWNATDYPDPADDPSVEIVRVTAKSTDTFTITRAQEGTTARTHELEGKVYKLIAPLTAKVINSEMLPVTLTGNDYEISVPDVLTIETLGSFLANVEGLSLRLNAQTVGVVLAMESTSASLGDVDGINSGVVIIAHDGDAQIKLLNGLLLTNSVSLPSSDPAIAGALYYDAGTGAVKRSAG